MFYLASYWLYHATCQKKRQNDIAKQNTDILSYLGPNIKWCALLQLQVMVPIFVIVHIHVNQERASVTSQAMLGISGVIHIVGLVLKNELYDLKQDDSERDKSMVKKEKKNLTSLNLSDSDIE